VTTTLLPAAFAVLLWWFGTGAILFLDALPKRTFLWSVIGWAGLAGVGLAGMAMTADDESVTGAYVAFTGAILVWGLNEMAFLTGWVTGPRKTPSPAGTPAWTRTRHAVEAILYHELALVASGAAIALATAGGANRTGLLTFAVLWVMRLSAKINIHLGVPNPGEGFLPDHLRYLASWFTYRPMNPFFPGAMILALAAQAVIAWYALHPGATPGEATGLALVATLLALALVEHLFLVLPLPSAALWAWARRSPDPLPRPSRRQA
jgi:putative photosynthetic complex assembly protein 2